MCSYFDLQKGDPTLSVLELWGAEYQESNALLLRSSDRGFLERVCRREKCPVDFVGSVTGDGKAGFSQGHPCTPSRILAERISNHSPVFICPDCAGG